MKREGSKKTAMIAAVTVAVLLLTVFGYFYKTGSFDISGISGLFTSRSSGKVTEAPKREHTDTPDTLPEETVKAYVPEFMMATLINSKDTFDLSGGEYSLKNQLKRCKIYLEGMRINTCMFTDTGDDSLNAVISEFFKENGIYACIYCDFATDSDINGRVINDGVDYIKDKVKNVNPNAVLICNCKNIKKDETNDSDDTLVNATDRFLSSLISAAKEQNPDVAVGILTGPGKETELKENYFDVEAFFGKGIADFAVVEMPYTMNDAATYNSLLSYWSSLLNGTGTPFFTELYNDKILTGGNWTNPVEITKQVIASTKISNYSGFLLRSFSGLTDNKQSSTSSLVKYINEDLSAESVLKELTVKYPVQKVSTTNEESVMFQGTTDVNYAVTINGVPAARNSEGDFAYTVKLKVGANKITFEHKGKTIVYTITRMINVLTDVSPTGYSKFDGKTTVAVSAVAYKDAKVTATLNGKTVSLTADYGSTTGTNTLYCTFNGSITLPAPESSEKNLGQILFYANYQGITGSKYGAEITVNKVSVGGSSGILTVTNTNLPFSYSGNSTYYYPCPDQSYLPAGTMDYVSGEPFIVKDGNDAYTFVKTVSGKRFQTKDVKISSLRDLGENAVKSLQCTNGNTTFTLDFGMTWNVPFNIQTDGVSYQKANYQDFKVTSYNPSEITVAFDYTTSVPEFSLPENSLFSSYRWDKEKDGDNNIYKLILKLKRGKSGTGYTAKYADGHLIITFTKPLTAVNSDNKYGGSLSGQVIALSPGHGGWDTGARGTIDGKIYDEADVNASITEKLKNELEKAGAVVVICDALTDNKPDYRARSKQASNAGAQIHIVVHQNSAGETATGFECWYYSPYSYTLSEYLQDAMEKFYKNSLYGAEYETKMDRGEFFSWISDTVYPESPTVLIETGFITNKKYCLTINDEDYQTSLAEELARGIVNYAKS